MIHTQNYPKLGRQKQRQSISCEKIHNTWHVLSQLVNVGKKNHLNLLNIRYYEIIRHNNAVITKKVKTNFRGYVFEWPRVTQATPRSGWEKIQNSKEKIFI